MKYPSGVKIGISRLCATAYLLAVFSWRFVRTLLTSKQWHTGEASISKVHTLSLIYRLVQRAGSPAASVSHPQDTWILSPERQTISFVDKVNGRVQNVFPWVIEFNLGK